MESDAQACVRTPERDRFLARWSIHHEARAREDALAVSLDDPAIDSARNAEIVSGNDEPLHGPSLLQRRTESREVAIPIDDVIDRPLGVIVQHRHRSKEQTVHIPRALGGVEQQVQLFESW